MSLQSRLTHRLRLVGLLLGAPLAASAALAATASAQVGSTTDIITGTIVGPQGNPIVGARVEVTSVETGLMRAKTTNDKGQYTLLFPDGGGQYTVVVRAIGMAPQNLTLARQADEDRLIANVTLSATTTTLSTVTVQARRDAPRPDERLTPGSTARQLSAEQLLRLPIDPSDPNAIALLAPGVVGIVGTDSTAASFSVAGQRADQNNVTLDGISFGTGAVPQEAIRNTRVVTSTYDIARGQFTGGLVQTTTRGGTNQPSGSFSYALRDPSLEFTADDEESGQTTFSQSYTQHQLSGGLGGPIIRNKLLVYGSGQLRRRINPLQSLLGVDPLTLQRLGTNADSAQRFLDLLGGYGLPVSVPSVPDDRLADNGSAVVRVDYTVSDDHTLMLRGNWQGSLQQGFRTSALTVPSFGGEQRSSGAGGMLSLSSVFGTFLNEARVGYSRSENNGDPYVQLPDGRVRVSSLLDDETLSVSTLEFGGNPGLPTQGEDAQLEVTNELSWLGRPGHRFKLGGLFNYTSFSSANTNNRLGTYVFNSLEDFAANTPASFTRTLTPSDREGDATNSAIYLGDVWRRSRTLQLTYGARVEHSAFLQKPAYNPAIESLFGRRTDVLPSELHVSPRLGFTWTVGGNDPQGQQGGRGGQGGGPGGGGQQRGAQRGGGGGGRGGFNDAGAGPSQTVIRGGIGEFRGRAPTQLFAAAIDATGLPGDQQQLVCIGAAVPVPDWNAYADDPASMPTACADGVGGQPRANQRPNVSLLDPEFGAPRAWRTSLGVTRRVSNRLGLNVEASYALGTHLYGGRDLNLRSAPRFTLADEDGRPVFVPDSAIIPTTGALSLLASREHAELAQVIEATSNLRSRTAQVTAGVNGVAFTGLIWNMSYTFMKSTDQTSFSGGGGRGTGSSTTGGDPNAVEWGRSDLERRHNVVGSLSWFVRPWLDLTSVVRLSSGTPYTPRVGSDINGDGSRNDRAFVFDPARTADTAIANGMSRLLAGTTGSTRECLRSQLDGIAGRNSCTGGWSPTLDLQANLRPNFGGTLGRRLNVMLSFVNPLAGIDQLLHGSKGLRGWGQQSRPDATLLYVDGFDRGNAVGVGTSLQSPRFLYRVNERFGDTRAGRTAIRNPFQIGLQARLQVGPDRQRELTQARLAAISNRGAGGRFDPRTMVERVAPNPATLILTFRDSLAITDSQAARLTAIGDSLAVQNDSLVAQLTAATTAAGASGDIATAFRGMQPRLQQARANYLAALERARGVLTPEQWQRLPEAIRTPTLPQGPGRRQGPGGGGGRPI